MCQSNTLHHYEIQDYLPFRNFFDIDKNSTRKSTLTNKSNVFCSKIEFHIFGNDIRASLL